ncbi:diguanylate cyclase [Oceanobacter kriegii]|uniref:diguanylate cyclase n=1 Tax=Oceanobacter kriegii TaxID=64972 RepID=UPI00042A7C54|nr:diguanylate cyclase [Oceanobacter kriegii]
MYLVVEDDPVVGKILRHLIKQTVGDNVVYARSMAELKSQLVKYQGRFRSALVDLALPDAEEGASVEAVMQCGVPCVVLTASEDPAARDKYLKAGVADFVNKNGRYWYLYAVRMLRRLSLNQDINVLVVDDSKMCTATMRRMLETNRYRIYEAISAENALEVLERRSDIHILVVDHELPGMNGLELVQFVRYKYPDRPLGIIAVSGLNKGREQLTVDFIKSGADDFLPKPFDQQEFMCRITNSTQATEAFLKLQEQASRDYLTGLYNRRYFSQQADVQLERYQSSTNTLALLDIDFFKKINDEYGHQAGDIVLKRLSEELLQAFHQLLVARVGGEEFALLMPTVPLDKAQALMDGFRQHMEGIVIDVEDGDYLRITLSIGICESANASVEQMFSVADECLYRAKIGGRNQVIGVVE